jgi:hypothetical protein
LNGNLLGQWKLDRQHSTVALTANNQLYETEYENHELAGIALFDRSTNHWERVQGVPVARPIGADHEDLVYRMKTNPPISYLGWFVPSRQTK